MIKHIKFQIVGTRNIVNQIAERYTFEKEAHILVRRIESDSPDIDHIIKMLCNDPIKSRVAMSLTASCNDPQHVQLICKVGFKIENLKF